MLKRGFTVHLIRIEFKLYALHIDKQVSAIKVATMSRKRKATESASSSLSPPMTVVQDLQVDLLVTIFAHLGLRDLCRVEKGMYGRSNAF